MYLLKISNDNACLRHNGDSVEEKFITFLFSFSYEIATQDSRHDICKVFDILFKVCLYTF